MPKKKKRESYASLGTKDIHDPLGLQAIPVTESAGSGFAKVANNILNGRHTLLPHVNRRPRWLL